VLHLRKRQHRRASVCRSGHRIVRPRMLLAERNIHINNQHTVKTPPCGGSVRRLCSSWSHSDIYPKDKTNIGVMSAVLGGPIMKLGRAPNPQRGEIWEHRDGGRMYIIDRDRSRVCVQRQPPSNPLAERWWIKLKTFEKMQAGKGTS
jgi:hypothetical protein